METAEELNFLVYALTGLGLIIGLFVLTVFLVFQRKRQKHLVQMAELQQEMLRSQIEIQEQTLQTVSQELHDNLGQRLGLVKLQLNAFGATPNDANMLADVKAQVTHAIGELRQISKSLHPEKVAQQGLLPSLQNMVDALNKTGSWKGILTTSGNGKVEKAATEVILFRMVQELMNNAIKHSGGNQFDVNLQFGEEGFTITCTDNGIGLPQKASSSIGLTSLRNRAALLKGKIEFLPNQPNGLKTLIWLPNTSLS